MRDSRDKGLDGAQWDKYHSVRQCSDRLGSCYRNPTVGTDVRTERWGNRDLVRGGVSLGERDR